MRRSHFRFFVIPLSGFIIGLIVLLCYLTGISATRSYDQKVTVFYPFLSLFHNKIFLTSFVLLILLAALMWITGKEKSIKVYAAVLMTLTVILACATVWQYFVAPNEEFRNSLEFQDNLYHLTVINGYVLGHDCDITAYVIYECDNLGLICSSYNTPYLDSYPDTQCAGKLTKSETTHFLVDSVSNGLYVQIGNERFPVEAKY